MKELLSTLKQYIDGEVHFDAIHRKVYSIDASIYEVEPIGIILPRTIEAIRKAVEIVRDFNIAIIARGAATGITGGCLGRGLIIDTSKYLNQIIEINWEKEYVVCQPGVVQEQLNAVLAPRGYRLGPDTSTGDRATLGGMLANNSAGSHSLYYGTMADHILEVEMILADGSIKTFKEISEKEWQSHQDKLYKELYRLRNEYAEEIKNQFPNIPRRVSGYNLDALIQPNFNPCRLIAGSEGTLGIVSAMKLKIVPILKKAGMCLIFFREMLEGMRKVEKMLAFQPCALEMIDAKIIEMGRRSPSMQGTLDWLTNDPEAIFIAEFQNESALTQFHQTMHDEGHHTLLLRDPKQIEKVWDLRRAGLGLLLSKRSYNRALAFIEDLSITPMVLAQFMEKFCAYLKQKGESAGIYGHVGSGCMHIRPYLDLRKNEDLTLMKQMMIDISNLVQQCGGALSGEHGDGLIRSWLNEKMFGKKLYRAFLELKQAFDPENLMNPGKIVNGPPVDENLRLDPDTPIKEISTFLDFTKEGGFALAVDLCNGNGLCRKSKDLMCPSFQATQDEFHTTRARAQALRSVINGKLPIKDLSSQGLYDVLDLCLECKGCKTECPSEVDMAKMKSEFLFHYHKEHSISWRSYFFSRLDLISWFGSFLPHVANAVSNNRFFKKLLGISEERNLPNLAANKFSRRKIDQLIKGKKVVLFLDTFTEFYCPEVGQAAVKVINSLGYEVIIPSWSCCGRPALSKGELPYAKKLSQKVVNKLLPYAEAGFTIIGLEPSCLLTLKEDYASLLGHDNAQVKCIADRCMLFDEWIQAHNITVNWNEASVHVHCHQKAAKGPKLRDAHEIPGGCCGMAGSFGYEEEHFDISMKIGNLHLFPAVKDSETVIANGFSCRSQIAKGTNKKAIHLAQFLAQTLNY